MQSIIDTKFPTDPNDLTPEILTAAISSERPGLIVERLEVVQAFYAATGQASTADRVILNLDYAKEAASAAAAEGLPRRVVLKTMLVSPHAPAVMYETEVRFYREIRPLVPFETPAYYGALFDPESGQFGIVLEDLTERGVVFPNVTMPTSMGQIRSLLGGPACEVLGEPEACDGLRLDGNTEGRGDGGAVQGDRAHRHGPY
jgi:hypothetical protein